MTDAAFADKAPGASASPLAEGFAERIGAWARGQGADAATARLARDAAFALSVATQDGHVCLALDELGELGEPGDPGAAQRDALLASGVVGTPQNPSSRPLILDDGNRLYLHRHFDEERRLAARLMRAAGAPVPPVGEAAIAQLRSLFPRGDRGVDWQQIAVALALRRRLSIVSGGPGTGKTSTVVKLLACLLADDPRLRIALAAPTGKAAARLAETVRALAATLPAAAREALPRHASTVHRLLVGLPAARSRDTRAQTLPIDVLVVDEASMLDLSLATRLLTALPDAARIVLLGDKDQLAAVESGAVFAELSVDPTLSPACRDELAALCGLPAQHIRPGAPQRASVLRDSVVWLSRNYRFAATSTLGRLADDIRAARGDDALQQLHQPADASLRWIDDGAALPGAASWQAMRAGYAPYFDSLRAEPANAGAVDAAFARFRVLCAVHAGPRGTQAVNEAMTRQCRDSAPAPADAASPWFIGRPVMVLRNDPVLKLFNGDIGVALPHAAADGELRVFFADPAGGHRAVGIGRLPPHDTAFAISVHKSQGSEFGDVLLLLPTVPNRVSSRELLYTAVTRARGRVTVCAGGDAVLQAIRSPTLRRSGLLARLAEAGGG